MNCQCAVCGKIEPLTTSFEDMDNEFERIHGYRIPDKEKAITCNDCQQQLIEWFKTPQGQAMREESAEAFKAPDQTVKPYRKLCERCEYRVGNKCEQSYARDAIYSKRFVVPLACPYRLEHLMRGKE